MALYFECRINKSAQTISDYFFGDFAHWVYRLLRTTNFLIFVNKKYFMGVYISRMTTMRIFFKVFFGGYLFTGMIN